MSDWNEKRITGSDKLSDILFAAREVNEDGMAVGLQPYEIRHLLNAVIAERKSIDSSLRHMPYLGGMHRTKSLAADVEKAVEVIRAAADRNGEIERDRDQMRDDIAAMRRILGTWER